MAIGSKWEYGQNVGTKNALPPYIYSIVYQKYIYATFSN